MKQFKPGEIYRRHASGRFGTIDVILADGERFLTLYLNTSLGGYSNILLLIELRDSFKRPPITDIFVD